MGHVPLDNYFITNNNNNSNDSNDPVSRCGHTRQKESKNKNTNQISSSSGEEGLTHRGSGVV